MLRSLSLSHVGPADRLVLDPLAERFNVITGDNGLGKSFLLDTAWWALTRTWTDYPAVPNSPQATIAFRFDGDRKIVEYEAPWDRGALRWKSPPGRPPNPGLVLFARVDGSFSAWDPARNYRLYTRADGGKTESPSAYHFGAWQVLDGVRRRVTEDGSPRDQVICAGLIDDWTRWQDTRVWQFELLRHLLEHLGPDNEPLQPGEVQNSPNPDEQRRMPTIRMPYGQDVPLVYAPAGVKRMCNLAYLLTWTLSEHQVAAARRGLPVSSQLIVLFDEPETHLHPRWQRTVLPSLARAIRSWQAAPRPDVQFLVATHSPLLLASLEPIFEPERDALWKLDLTASQVSIAREVWQRRGDVSRWLESDVFGLEAATATEVQSILREANGLLAADKPEPQAVQRVDAELVRLLPDMDPFLIRWRYYMADPLAGDPR